MPPEQARGDLDRLGPWSDVFSLGAILFEVLTGRALYHDAEAHLLLDQAGRGSWSWSGSEDAPGVGSSRGCPADPGRPPRPEALIALCEQSLSPVPAQRPGDASMLARAVRAWLLQAQKRERGLAALAEVADLPNQIADLKAQTIQRRAAAHLLLAEIKTWAPVSEKRAAWDLEDEADRLEQAVDLKQIEYLQGLRGALMIDPELPEAHAALATHYRQTHAEAEVARDRRSAESGEVMLRAHDGLGRYTSYLKGDGALTLHTEPQGANVS
jgi:serine/threonine-protein kinase